MILRNCHVRSVKFSGFSTFFVLRGENSFAQSKSKSHLKINFNNIFPVKTEEKDFH